MTRNLLPLKVTLRTCVDCANGGAEWIRPLPYSLKCAFPFTFKSDTDLTTFLYLR